MASASISPSASVSPSGSISPSPSVGIESVRVYPRKALDRVTCRVYLSVDQEDLTDGNWTKVLLNTVDYDLGTNFDIVTNNRFTVPVSGLYLIFGKVDFSNAIANKNYGCGIYINNALTIHDFAHTGDSTNEVTAAVEGELFLNKDNYIELYAISNAGVNTVDLGGGNHHTLIHIRLVTREGIR